MNYAWIDGFFRNSGVKCCVLKSLLNICLSIGVSAIWIDEFVYLLKIKQKENLQLLLWLRHID